MSILKPNIPLKYVKPDGTTQSEYPLTSIDQVIDEDGIHRLNQTIVKADLSDVEEGQVVLTNADLLDNHPASYFATKSDVDSAIEELNTAIENSGLKTDLLWTNANPTSAFASQTINVNLSNYKQTAIIYNTYGSGLQRFNTSIITIGINHILNGTGSDGGTDSTFTGTLYNTLRSVTATSSKISFGSGYIKFINSSSISKDDNAIIPRMIYGIK